ADGFAGNAFSPSIVKEGDDYYMYHNDESVHGGIHRWKITGLNTIKEETIPITASFVRSTEALDGIDLMAGLPSQGSLSSNSQGWTRTPDAETNDWSAKTNLLSYGVRKSPDLSVTYNPSATGVSTINRDLGNNNNLTNWGITGNVGYSSSEPNSPDGLGLNQYLDVLDNTGKIIVRFYQKINYSTSSTTIYANNTPLFTRGVGEMRALTKSFQPFDMDKIGGTITVTYAGQSAVVEDVYEAGANISNPTTMRLYFSNVGGALYGKAISISDFRFIPFNTTLTPAAPIVTADYSAKTLIASHQLGNSEILVSENNGEYVQYTGAINVGNVARPAAYWQFKIKPAIQRNVSAMAKSPEFVESYQCSATGSILHEVWYNVNGSNISSNDWSRKPDNTSPVTVFEAPQNIGDNFAARIRGYLCPPQTGYFTFWISGDDATELWLSTDSDPANKSKIAYNTSYTAPGDRNRFATQKSVQIFLKAGNKYYIEALHKEGSGQDHLQVVWQLPNGNIDAPIPGKYLSPFNSSDLEAITAATQQCSATGTILHEVWNNVNGANINSNNWSKKADNTSPLAEFEAPQNFGDNFAARIRGYICPPESGNYTFWISGDDATELWLSTDADPANKIKIAYSVSATYSRNWGMFDSQKSFQIYLRAGNKYYIEALHKEAGGADHLAVAWQFPSGSMEAPIAGSHLSPFDPDFDKTPVIPCSATGTISHEVWNNVNGLNVNSNNWNNKSNSTTILTALEAPQNIGDNYAARIRGYICPPLSGNYTFWISGDDATELWLSTDSDPGNKIKIAYSVFATYFRNWSMFDSQKSFKIYLRAGNKYYIEALHKEVGGADHLSVAWQLPDGTMEAPIPGSRLSPFNPDFNTTLNARVLTGTAVS
ncbi:MAG: PA14 domain-containing protein, partial [Segetibacter sp.]